MASRAPAACLGLQFSSLLNGSIRSSCTTGSLRIRGGAGKVPNSAWPAVKHAITRSSSY